MADTGSFWSNEGFDHMQVKKGTRRRLARAVAAASPCAIEQLEDRRLLAVAITGSVTLDETAGLQNTGALAAEDANDNDVAVGNLPSSFSTRLFTGLGLSSAFATQVGVGKSADNFVTVSGAGTIASLGFTKADGTALPVLGGADPGVASGLSAVNGGAISLFQDSALGNRMVVGVDANGDKVLAVFLDPNATLTSAKVWSVQFEALSSPDATNPDDAVTLGGLGVGAGSSIQFDFDELHAGSNLFGTVGDATNSLIVIAEKPKLKANGTLDSAGQAVKTSQGGTGATIGIDSQMIDPGEGAFFTYVKGSDPNFLAAALDQGEANDSAAIKYSNGTNAATSASVTISQTQGPTPGTMTVAAFDVAGSPQQKAFVDGIIAGGAAGIGAAVTITSITIHKANGTTVTENAAGPNTSANISFAGGVATVSGLGSGDEIQWTTSAPHDRVLIKGVAGKFDVGAFSIDQANSESAPLNGVRFEDDGPFIGPIQNAIVDFVAGATVTKTLNGAVGIDPKTDPYTVDSFTASVTVNSVEVRGVLAADKKSVTYWANTNGDGTFGNTGDTPYYRLTLLQNGSGEYKFDVLFSPPPADLNFDFDELHAGSNLFGTVGDATNSLIVIAEKPKLKANGTLDSAGQAVKTSQGGTGATIGIDSQMIDPGEGAFFTYVKGSDPNFLAAALDQGEANDSAAIKYSNGTNAATSASVTISQTQGPTPGTMTVAAFDVAGSPQQKPFVDGISTGTGIGAAVTITSITIHKANGTTVTENAAGPNTSANISFAGGVATVSGLGSGDEIQWTTSAPHDRVLIKGVAGKFDVGAFKITQSQPTPDQKLDFVAKVVDGDGDSNTASFSIGIDGTGIFDDGIVIL